MKKPTLATCLLAATGTAILIAGAAAPVGCPLPAFWPQPGMTLDVGVNGQDADGDSGRTIPFGEAGVWTYVVTNTGYSRLMDITVIGSDGVVANCPKKNLEPGESMTCTSTGTSAAGQRSTVGTAMGMANGVPVIVNASGQYVPGDAEETPSISIQMLTNGYDAGVSPGRPSVVGDPVLWTYVVTNLGNVSLTDVTVSDDQGVTVNCPATLLDSGQTMVCTASGTAVAGQHAAMGTATGMSPSGSPVSASDASYYVGMTPAITLEKLTNGEDADLPPGPSIAAGDAVQWTYVVTNAGDVELTDVVVSDGAGVVVSCPKTTLAAGESMTCTGTGVAAAGQYSNVGTATGVALGRTVMASDASHYQGRAPSVALEKLTNGQCADLSPGAAIAVGDTIQWTYVVTNTGDVELSDVLVSDDQCPAVACPKTTLAPSESITCTGTGTAAAGSHPSVGTATGTAVGRTVSASDAGYYLGMTPGIGLEKFTNGEDADTAPGPSIAVGDTVQWTYVVTNGGETELTNVLVSDDQGVAVSCPKTTLAPGESMTCTGTGTAVAGQYANVGTATGAALGGTVTASDPSHYLGVTPSIGLEKRTNGEDADLPPGPSIPLGSAVQWTYAVTNTGDVALTSVAVTDDQGVVVTCPKTALEPGETMTCTGAGTAVAGQYVNVGSASGSAVGQTVTASDASHYLGGLPSIDLEKLTNGQDADAAPGPSVLVGSTVLWTYVVTNTGDVLLSDVTITDDKGVAVTCPKTSLAPGESMTCTGTGTAVTGQYVNVGTATGTPPAGSPVSDTDSSHYYGVTSFHGCTPGYWKNHTGSWPATGYSPSQAVDTVFANVNTYYPALGNATLLQSLGFAGGPGNEGAAEILLRAGVAALLNASHPGEVYPRTPADVIASVNAALLQSRDTMLALAAQLDADNNRGCPLN